MAENSLFGSGHEVATSTSRPTATTGQLVYETDTRSFSFYNGSSWVGLVPPGTISAWPTATAPDGWLLCYGQAVSRTTYANLFSVLGGNTVTSMGTRVSVSSTITGMTGMKAEYVGLQITGYAINPSAVVTIASVVDSSTITLSEATASLPTSTSLYTIGGVSYGNGDGSTTFNVPDMRGRRPAGFDNMGGTSASRLTFSSANLLNDALGDCNMPSHYHSYGAYGTTGNDSPDHAHQWPLCSNQGGQGGNDAPARSINAWDPNFRTGWRSNAQYGGATDRPHSHTVTWYGYNDSTFSNGDTYNTNVPPFMVLSYVIKY